MWEYRVVVNLWLVADADVTRSIVMIGYTQYALQSQANFDFKWTKLDLQVQYSFCVFLELFISPECDGIKRRKSKTVWDEHKAGCCHLL